MTDARAMVADGPVHHPIHATDVAALIRESGTGGRALRIRGAGTWMDAGHSVRAAATLTLDAMRGIIGYRPDDLTISVGAGTTLAELDEATRAHGQWCPLLPWGDDTGTVGATVATATSGPFAERLGRPRDLVLGLECVDGTGRVIAAGGKVVKNVAGFDLTRAVTGSWGTLAVITQLHLRLRARPTVDETWALSPPNGEDAAVVTFDRGHFAPLAALAVSEAHASVLALGGARWLVRIGGNAAFVAAARDALRAIGDSVAVDPAVWDDVRTRLAPPARAIRWRWDALSSRLRERFDPARVLNPGLLGEPA